MTMGDYYTPGQRPMEIMLPKGHIISPEGSIILQRDAVDHSPLILYSGDGMLE